MRTPVFENTAMELFKTCTKWLGPTAPLLSGGVTVPPWSAWETPSKETTGPGIDGPLLIETRSPPALPTPSAPVRAEAAEAGGDGIEAKLMVPWAEDWSRVEDVTL